MRLSLSLLADDAEAADEHADAMRTMREGMATPAMEWNEFGVLYATASWRPGGGRAGRPRHARVLPGRRRTTFGRTPLLHVLALAGMEDELRAELARAPLPPLHDDWFVTTEASVRALVAGYVGDEAMARRSVELLRPLSGRMAVSGISIVIGPGRRLPGDRPGHARRARGGGRVRRAGGGAGDPVGDDGLPALARRVAGTLRVLGAGSEHAAPSP